MSDLASKASRTVVRIFDFYALLSGITALHIDFACKRILHSRRRSIYAICVNLLLAAGIPFFIQYDMEITELIWQDGNFGNMARKNLVLFMDAASVILCCVMIYWLLLCRRKHERLYEAMALEFFALDRAYFDQVPTQVDIEKRLGLLLLAKAILLFGDITGSLIGYLFLEDEWSVQALADIFFYIHLYSMTHCRMFDFFVSLAQAYKRFQLLNGQLAKLLQEVQIMHAYAAIVLHVDGSNVQRFRQYALTELEEISRTHWRLTCLVQRICNTFYAQILAVLFTSAIENIVGMFYSMLIIDGTMKTQYGMIVNSFEIFASILVIFHMFCLYRLSEATANAQECTGEILRAFQTLPPMDVAFERCCERFSLQLLQQRSDISMGGMFSLNRETLLALLVFVMRQMVLLVQFDLELRLRQLPKWT